MKLISISLALSLQIPAVTSGDSASESGIPVRHGLPGRKTGTERWLVRFKTRSFDLREFRDAIHSRRSAKAVASIVSRLERRVREDQAGFVSFIEKLGGDVVAGWWLVNACAIEVPFAELETVRAHPDVLQMHPDEEVLPLARIKVSTNSGNHAADALQALGTKGKGVTVAIMDTGVDEDMGGSGIPHRMLYVNGDKNNRTGGGLKGSRLLSNKLVRGASVGPDDKHGHGTGVTGIAAGEIWTNQASDRGHAPLAGIAGYAIAINLRGSSSLSIIAQAWQDIAKDKVALGIVVANNSYSGSYDPTNISQQMLDSAALNADVLPVVAAGNSGASTSSSQSAANGLAVGATSPDTRVVATFSSRGPLMGDAGRFYPDLCANGVGTVMPKKDNETANYTASGTSMAAPQVSGAAALFRSVLPTASALVAKAALLASTEDIASKNTKPPYNSRNAFGLGYLRDDRLVAIAQGKNGSMIRTGSVSVARPKAVFPFPVTNGKGYAVVLAWHRHALASKAWSDLNLSVKLGTRTLATSQDPRNLYEKAVFVAPQSGSVSFEVTYKGSLDAASVPFALVATEVPAPFVPGSAVTYGASCMGSGQTSGVTTILPKSYGTRFGESANTYPLAFRNTRTQQIFATSEVPSSFVATGIAFRHDEQHSSTILGYSAELEFKLGFSARSPATMSTSFSTNVSGTLTTVMARKFVKLPNPGPVNTNPANFIVRIALDRPYVYNALPGRYLLFEAVKTRDSRVLTYFVDAVAKRPALSLSRLFALSPTAATGSVNPGYGVVVGFSSPTSGGAKPVLAHGGPPLINKSFELRLSRARASTGALLVIGASDEKWAGLTLPFDLTSSGATGCKILASLDTLLPTGTDTSGSAKLSVLVPNDKSLIQKRIFFQSLILDPPANRMGIVLTNGLRAVVGGQP